MKGRALLLNFSLGCLLLAGIFGAINLLTQHASTDSAFVLLFIGLLGIFTNAVLKEYDDRLKALEKRSKEEK